MKINNENKCNPLKGYIELIGEYKISFGSTVPLTQVDKDYIYWTVRKWYEYKLKIKENKNGTNPN